MYLLDTTTCIDYLRGRYPRVRDILLSKSPKDTAVGVITVAELRYGAEKSAAPAAGRQTVSAFLAPLEVLSWTEEAAEEYARIRRHLEQQGTPIGANDLLIAAQSVVEGATLVTSNVREFQRVPGLRWEDWRGGGEA